ncbi:hypothetical protein PoB_004098300 [Plakobranchus ocellatus]|uniref:Uncharacterized protein n=1 Tax=Plakobranchus ocellatus TaxID=259542 RepID=A0AAV4B5W2_9GAST|nr:hypothetical protein PoB_004098300 [Plakobranchus ocellatus]
MPATANLDGKLALVTDRQHTRQGRIKNFSPSEADEFFNLRVKMWPLLAGARRYPQRKVSACHLHLAHSRLSDSDQNRLRSLVLEYSDVMAHDEIDLGQ